MKRSELLNQSDDAKQKEASLHQVALDELQLQADLLETQRQLGIKKAELLALKSATELSPVSIIAKQDEIAGLEAGEKALIALKEELF